ncbi:MAG: tyrosine-type recombinase/integrase [Deltaproteobacteria bacterium]|nr:tyrosine-type recombinase/integrase [Deltaproteobacteria bacterium]
MRVAYEVHAKKTRSGKSWGYEFRLPGRGKFRKGRFATKADALMEGRALAEKLLAGGEEFTFKDAYEVYMRVTTMTDRSRDKWEHVYSRLGPHIGHVFIEDVTTSLMDELKLNLPEHLGPKSVNHHLALIKAVLRYMWKREHLKNVPYVPMERVPVKKPKWYTQEERDKLLDGMFRLQPRWYLFFYLTCRLGLRVGEVYAISKRQISEVPPRLLVDQAVQRGTKERPAILKTRKNNEEYSLELTQDMLDAIKWHYDQGYGGDEYLFSMDGTFPTYIDSYVRPLQSVQRELGMRTLSHHAIGRHSVASQAATGGESIKVIQMQLGHRSEASTHKYAHTNSEAQLRLVKSLTPVSPPHAKAGQS